MEKSYKTIGIRPETKERLLKLWNTAEGKITSFDGLINALIDTLENKTK